MQIKEKFFSIFNNDNFLKYRIQIIAILILIVVVIASILLVFYYNIRKNHNFKFKADDDLSKKLSKIKNNDFKTNRQVEEITPKSPNKKANKENKTTLLQPEKPKASQTIESNCEIKRKLQLINEKKLQIQSQSNVKIKNIVDFIAKNEITFTRYEKKDLENICFFYINIKISDKPSIAEQLDEEHGIHEMRKTEKFCADAIQKYNQRCFDHYNNPSKLSELEKNIAKNKNTSKQITMMKEFFQLLIENDINEFNILEDNHNSKPQTDHLQQRIRIKRSGRIRDEKIEPEVEKIKNGKMNQNIQKEIEIISNIMNDNAKKMTQNMKQNGIIDENIEIIQLKQECLLQILQTINKMQKLSNEIENSPGNHDITDKVIELFKLAIEFHAMKQIFNICDSELIREPRSNLNQTLVMDSNKNMI